MYTALLDDMPVWRIFLQHPVLRESLFWLQQNAGSADLGDHQLGVAGWYANVHRYTTGPEAECQWENHRNTVDIQFLVEGNEGIRWVEAGLLGPPMNYLEDLDRQEFGPFRAIGSFLHLRPGMFAIFFPGEAHCPKILLDKPSFLRKVVVKIPLRILGVGQ